MTENLPRQTPIIRPWTIHDIDGILSVQSSATGVSFWDRSAYEKVFEIGLPNYGCVAAIGDQVVGFACFRAIVPEAELLNLAVASALQRTGIGKKLLDYFVRFSAKIEASVLYLEVRESNLPAIGLYASAGFEEIGRRKAYYSAPTEDALTFQLRIF